MTINEVNFAGCDDDLSYFFQTNFFFFLFWEIRQLFLFPIEL